MGRAVHVKHENKETIIKKKYPTAPLAFLSVCTYLSAKINLCENIPPTLIMILAIKNAAHTS